MGLHLFFLTNFPGAMFIQGSTFIPDSRVVMYCQRQVFLLQLSKETCYLILPYVNTQRSDLATSLFFDKLCNHKQVYKQFAYFSLIFQVYFKSQKTILFVCCLFIYLVLKHSYQGLVRDLDGNENKNINIDINISYKLDKYFDVVHNLCIRFLSVVVSST